MLVPAAFQRLGSASRRAIGILVAVAIAAVLLAAATAAGSAGATGHVGVAAGVASYDAWYLDSPAGRQVARPFDDWFDGAS